MQRVLILGQEGYIGTALTAHLEKHGFEVFGCDNHMRENNVRRVGSESLTEKKRVGSEHVDITSYNNLRHFVEYVQPDTIVHLAEQPSAPFSMRGPYESTTTQANNIIGTLNVLWVMKEVCPDAHLVKLGTEGEYPDWLWNGKHIPEGPRMNVRIESKCKDHKSCVSDDCFGNYPEWEIPTPRYAGSWYHWSKVHDSMNIDYACRIWGLKVTDVNQGIVYGHTNETRFDYDEYFGTIVNRFITQAVAGIPLTVYGTGEQTRGFIALKDSIEAIRLLIESEPEQGEFRVIHQTTKEYSLNEIARMIEANIECDVEYIENPRAEQNENKFTFDNSTLMDLGLEPTSMEDEIPNLIETVRARKERIDTNVIKPTTTWK